uniref:Uncharacterized protein n=1 Tax=Arundo donax TaxID=35708 RepID=A0A0A8Z1I5_ARUDO
MKLFHLKIRTKVLELKL